MVKVVLGVLALAGMSSCATVAPSAPAASDSSAGRRDAAIFERALVEPQQVAAAIATEARIAQSSQTLPGPQDAWFEAAAGSQRVIVSAPHATRPMREGQYRFSDGPGTAALAQALHTACGVSVINTTRDSPSDPNYYDDNDYKRALGQLIAQTHPVLVLDIHGSHPSRPYEVDLGTMKGASLLGHDALATSLLEHLRAEGMVNLSDNRFAASGKQTVTKFAAGHGVPAIQLEISATRLQPGRGCTTAATAPGECGSVDSHLFAQLLQGLIRYLGDLGQCSAPPVPVKPEP